MFDSLRIEGYRGFKELTVEPLRQVNLFVGLNSSGKTSVLEAVELLTADEVVPIVFESGCRRGEFGFDAATSNWLGDHRFNLDRIFNGGVSATGRIKIGGKKREDSKTTLGMGVQDEATTFWTSLGGTVQRTVNVEDGRYIRTQSNRDLMYTKFVGPGGLQTATIIQLYADRIQSGSRRTVLEAIKFVDPRITDFYPLVVAGKNEFLAEIGEPTPVALTSMGDGVKRVLGLVMASSSGIPVLCVDEIDSGIHYSVLGTLWDTVIRASERGPQLFATTHSLDCLRGLAQALRENPELLPFVAVHRVARGADRTIRYVDDRLENVLNEEIEIR